MLSLDLFDSRFEKKLHEGAVDNTIEHLLKPLSLRAADIRTEIRSGKLDSKRVAELEKEYEDLVQRRLDIIMHRDKKVGEAEQPKQPPAKGLLKGKDLISPQQRVAGATPAKPGIGAAVKDVAGGIKRWLKGEPDQGPTYEDSVSEQQQQLSKRGQGIQNMKNLQASLDGDLNSVIFQFRGNVRLSTDEEGMQILVDYYNGMDSAGRTNFVYNVLGDHPQFTVLCRQLGVELTPLPDTQLELPLTEKRIQKKKFKSPIAQRELEKAMAAEPAAGDPIEAFILRSIENDQAQSQQLQDLAQELQAVKSAQRVIPAQPQVTPTTTPAKSAPVVTAPVAPAVGKGTAEPATGPVTLPGSAEVPDVKNLPKKDQKILSRVKRIEKRLKDRVDQYQTAQALKDTTPEKLATMQQQIDALTAQIRSQAAELTDQGQQVVDINAIPVLGQTGADLIDFTQALRGKQARTKAQAQTITKKSDEPLPPLRRYGTKESRIREHGGGIGPRQHWQDLMQEGQPQELIHRYLAIDAETDVDAVRAAIQAISRDSGLSVTSKSRLLGQIGMIIRRHRLPIGRSYYQFMQQYMEDINETALNPKDLKGDYEAKRRALHDLSLNKDVDQAAVLQRRLDLDREAKTKGLAETVTNVKAGMAEIYRRLAPKIERHRDSFLAGQLYDELENYAELHGAEGEFKRMMNGARNRAHMEYDTNPGGFQNWFWFLPFEDEQLDEISRRDFLKGVGATAGAAALGTPKGAQAQNAPRDAVAYKPSGTEGDDWIKNPEHPDGWIRRSEYDRLYGNKKTQPQQMNMEEGRRYAVQQSIEIIRSYFSVLAGAQGSRIRDYVTDKIGQLTVTYATDTNNYNLKNVIDYGLSAGKSAADDIKFVPFVTPSAEVSVNITNAFVSAYQTAIIQKVREFNQLAQQQRQEQNIRGGFSQPEFEVILDALIIYAICKDRQLENSNIFKAVQNSIRKLVDTTNSRNQINELYKKAVQSVEMLKSNPQQYQKEQEQFFRNAGVIIQKLDKITTSKKPEFEESVNKANDVKKRMSKLEAMALAANRAGDDAKCKMYQQKIQLLKQKLSQSMAEGWSDKYVAQRTGQPRTPYSVYIDGREWKAFANDDHARAVAEKVRANLERQGRKQTVTIAPSKTKRVQEEFGMPGTTIPRKSVIQGYTVFWNPKTQVVSVTRGGDSEEAAIEQVRIGTVNLKTFRQAAERLIDKIDDQLINEGVRDTASATAVVACLLAGGSLSGCATAPEQMTVAQAVKTGQDVGRIILNAKKITRAGTEEEVQQELRNIMRGMTTRPEEMNSSNIMRIWRRINQPEPQPQNEAYEPKTKQEFDRIHDKLSKQIDYESNPAIKQILRLELKKLEDRGRVEGWFHGNIIREDTAALAAEDAILKRIFVRHKDLMMEYGADKIAHAAESVAYNVGNIAHITDEQINEWVDQVKQILGADA